MAPPARQYRRGHAPGRLVCQQFGVEGGVASVPALMSLDFRGNGNTQNSDRA